MTDRVTDCMTGPAGSQDILPRTPLLARCHSVWLHGAGLSGDTWHPLTAHLPRARTPDLPGHGAAPLVHPPRVERFAELLSPTLPAGAVVIGHSMGGMVALELAARWRDRIGALVMIEAVPTIRDRLSGRINAAIARSIFARIPPAWLSRLAGIGQTEATAAELRRQLRQTDRGRVAAALEAASLYDGRPHLAGVAVPSLVIIGRRDRATHRGATLMADTIPGAELTMLDGGHMLHTDTPGAVLETIEGFLARHLPPS